jgi:hypothetical protein
MSPLANRANAKAEMIEPTCALLTPKERAKSGKVGAIIPNPTATKNEAKTRTPTSRGKSRRGFLSLMKVKITRVTLQQTHYELLHNLLMCEAVFRARRAPQRIRSQQLALRRGRRCGMSEQMHQGLHFEPELETS